MDIFKTYIFEKSVSKFKISKVEIDNFESSLKKNPTIGDIIVGTGGCRKARIKIANNKGKSSGARIIYYYIAFDDTIYLLLAYTKSKKVTMNDIQKKMLKQTVKKLKDEHRKH